MGDIKIREATVRDAEAIAQIYAPYVENTAVSFEYKAPSAQEMRERIIKTLEKYPFIAAEKDGGVIGYAYASRFKEREAYDYAVETSIYVKKGETGQGTGRALHEALESVLKAQGVLNLNACVAYTDTEDEYLTNGSASFHEKMGYVFVGRFKSCGYKFGRWYDMVWLEKHIGGHTKTPPRLKLFGEVRELCAKEYGLL